MDFHGGGFHQSAVDVGERRLQAFIGQVTTGESDTVREGGINRYTQTRDVWTIAVPGTVDNSATYTISIQGHNVSFTTDGGATQDELGDGLVAAFNADGFARGLATASYTGGVLTITANYPGLVLVLAIVDTSTTNDLSTLTNATAAAVASEIEPGRLLMALSFETQEAGLEILRPVAAQLTAMVRTLGVVYAASEVYLIGITFQGVTYNFQVDANTDTDTTVADIVSAINGGMPANSVIASDDGGGASTDVILTSERAGVPFFVSFGTKSGTAARLTLTDTTTGIGTNIYDVLRGLSERRNDRESTNRYSSNANYERNSGVTIAKRARMWVEVDAGTTISYGDKVYGSQASATPGRLYNSDSSSRFLLPNARWLRGARTDGNNTIAEVEFTFQPGAI